MDQCPLQLERYFFPHQEVIANPDYIVDGRKDGSKLKSEVNIDSIEGKKGAFAVEVTISLDKETSDNPAYFFRIQAYGLFNDVSDLPREDAQAFAETAGVAILVGAIRERLADMTCRGPWGTYMMGLAPLVFQPSSSAGQSTEP